MVGQVGQLQDYYTYFKDRTASHQKGTYKLTYVPQAVSIV